MVEKISEVSMSVAMKGASTPDDHALLKQIAKKKKQDKSSEMPALVAMLPPEMLVQLTTPSARGAVCRKPKSWRRNKPRATLRALPQNSGRQSRAMACAGRWRRRLLVRWPERTEAAARSASGKARSMARQSPGLRQAHQRPGRNPPHL